jgi:hypothetical protein
MTETAGGGSGSLYETLALRDTSRRPERDDRPSGPPPPETGFTATIETMDNDRATALLGGVGYP